MSKRVLLFKIIICFSLMNALHANPDVLADKGYQVSILTCDKSDATVYSIFGHSALRIRNENNSIDRVYNFGTFNPNTSGFYWNFIRGKAKYFISRQDNIQYFLDQYIAENRSVTEQVLDINQEKIRSLMDSLDQVLNSENRYYYYDFIYNNCTTKLVEIIHDLTDSECLYRNEVKGERLQSLRKVISRYADDPLLLMGLNLILGCKNDKLIGPNVSLFLPDTLYQRIEAAQVYNRGLMIDSHILADIQNTSKRNRASHVYIFIVIIVLIVLIVLWKIKGQYYNLMIWWLTGIIGILLLVLSVVTEIDLIQKNINIFLINPLYLFLCFKRIPPAIFYIIIISNLLFLLYSLINGYFIYVLPVWLIITISLYNKIKMVWQVFINSSVYLGTM